MSKLTLLTSLLARPSAGYELRPPKRAPTAHPSSHSVQAQTHSADLSVLLHRCVSEVEHIITVTFLESYPFSQFVNALMPAKAHSLTYITLICSFTLVYPKQLTTLTVCLIVIF